MSITTTTIPGRNHNHGSVAGGGSTLAPTVLILPSAIAPDQTELGSVVADADDGSVTVGDGVGRSTLTRLATQAELEAESAVNAAPSPNRVRWSPGVAKLWVNIDTAGLITSPSYNVASVTDTGTGDRTIVIATDFSSAIYSPVGGVGGAATYNGHYTSLAVGSVALQLRDGVTSTAVDLVSFTAIFGDHA